MDDTQFQYADERFADLQMLRYRLNGFETLSLQQKKYIYFLAKATLTGRDITTDQQGVYNLTIRKVLEAVYDHYENNRQDANFQDGNQPADSYTTLRIHINRDASQ